VLRALRFLFGPSPARCSSWPNDAGENIAEMSQAQMIGHTVRMANAPQTRRSLRIGGQRRNVWPRIPSETSGSDFSDESDPSERFLGFLNNGPGWRETDPGVWDNGESAPQGASQLRFTQVPRNPPDVNEYGEQFSSDESGDGPGGWNKIPIGWGVGLRVPEGTNPSFNKETFFRAWPLISDWIRADRNKRNRRIVSKMCKKQRKFLLQTAFRRMQLYVCANNQEILRGVLDPADPHRGWDSFLKIHNTGEVHTAQERWVSYTSWSLDIQHTDRIAEQKRRIQRYKDDMSDTSDSSLDSSRPHYPVVSRDGSCSSYTDSDEEHPQWDFDRWLAMRGSVRQPNIRLAYAATQRTLDWSAQRRDEVLQTERQEYENGNQGQGRDREDPLPNNNRTPGADAHGRAFSSDEDGDGPCAPYAHPVRNSGNGPSEEILCVACQTLKKDIFLETWPYIAKWIKSDNEAKRRIVDQLYRRTGNYPLQVAFYRLWLSVLRRQQEMIQEGPQNPTDSYLGWDAFFWLDTMDGVINQDEEWAWVQMWMINRARLETELDDSPNGTIPFQSRYRSFRWAWAIAAEVQNQEDQEVAEGNRRYAEAERIRLQPNNDYELRMSDNELAELRQRRLDYVDDSDVEGSSSSADGTTLLWGRTPTSQDEADLEAHEARDASDADWLEQNMRWHDTAQQD
jgi:hypothetical protein